CSSSIAIRKPSKTSSVSSRLVMSDVIVSLVLPRMTIRSAHAPRKKTKTRMRKRTKKKKKKKRTKKKSPLTMKKKKTKTMATRGRSDEQRDHRKGRQEEVTRG